MVSDSAQQLSPSSPSPFAASSSPSIAAQPLSTASSATNTFSSPISDQRSFSSNSLMSPPMKERSTSAATDRSGRPIQLMTVSPPPLRLGSRSPASIPSSPTSVHSSSSAIFERDIENPPSHPFSHAHSHGPHRTPRSKTTEPLDHSVPSVLDSAAALLATTDELEEGTIAVEAPTTPAALMAMPSRGSSTLNSPIGRGSRSPSPTTSAAGGGDGWRPTSMLLNLPSPVQNSSILVMQQPGSPPRLSALTSTSSNGASPSSNSHRQQSQTFGGNGIGGSGSPKSVVSTLYESASSSPTTTTMEHPPHAFPPVTPTPIRQQSSSSPEQIPHSSSASPLRRPNALPSLSHPPSPSQTAAASKRLSFVSYSDILASTPISTLPLSSLTSPSTVEPPPHLPSVALTLTGSTHNVSIGGPGSPRLGGPLGLGSRTTSAAASAVASARNSVALDDYDYIPVGPAADVKEPSGGIPDDMGGEWEREGLGKGLEERLEALMHVGPGKA